MGRPARDREAAIEMMDALVLAAVRTSRADPALAAWQAAAARAVGTRNRARMPYWLRIAFCKRCKSFVAPGAGSRVRIGGSQTRAVRITCLLCGHTYRCILPRAAPAGTAK